MLSGLLTLTETPGLPGNVSRAGVGISVAQRTYITAARYIT